MTNNEMKLRAKQDLLVGLHYMGNRPDLIRDTHGNLSTRKPDGFCIKPSGMEYQDITLDDLCEVNKDLVSFSNTKKKPSVDLKHHAAIYQKNPHIKSICHTHSTFVVANAIANNNLLCYCTEHADVFGDTIYCMPYADLDRWGDVVATFFWKFPTAKAVLMQNHGCITIGNSPIDAVKTAIALENIAEKNYYALTLNANLEPMKSDEVLKWNYRYNTSYGQ